MMTLLLGTSRWVAALGLAAALTGCAARSARLPAVEVTLTETPKASAPRERLKEKLSFNVTLIGKAALRYQKPSELLAQAETATGGDPQALMRAARTLQPSGEGLVLLGTVRTQAKSGGSQTSVIVYQLALGCAKDGLSGPGDLEDCRGYLLRVPRAWPAEVYELEGVTVSLIPEGGTATGRLRARSAPGGFKAELEGEFAASLVHFDGGGTVAAAPEE